MFNLIQTHPNTFRPGDSRLFSAIAKDLTPYVESLRNQLKTASDALMAALALSAPIHQVPDEILLNVFEYLFYVRYDFEYWSECNGLLSLRQISLVCKRWRSIITCTPKFWATIDVPQLIPRLSPCPDSYYDRDDDFLSSLALSTNAQVARAGDLPLIVLSSSITEPALDILSSYFHRITSIKIKLSERIATGFFARTTNMPNLVYLSVIIDEISGGNNSPGLTIILSKHDVPRLTHIHLDLRLPLSQLSVPLAQLQMFDIRLQNENIFHPSPFSIISKLTKVERLRMSFKLSIQDQPSTNWSDLALPCLRSLSLDWLENLSARFLQRSHFPSLQHLSIGAMQATARAIIDALCRPELWKITSLQLSFFSRSDVGVEFEETLRQFKFLNTCNFHVGGSPGIADTIFRAMARDSGEALLPRLKHLTIDAAHYHDQALDPLQTMLRKRVSNVKVPFPERKALMTVTVDYSQPCDWGGLKPSELCNARRYLKPPQYNDSMTSVQVGGRFDESFLEEMSDTV